jgi:hypothetical protein
MPCNKLQTAVTPNLARKRHRKVTCISSVSGLRCAVHACNRSTIARFDAARNLGRESVSTSALAVLRQAIVGAIELQAGDSVIALDAGSFL